MPLGSLGSVLPDGGEAIRAALNRRASGGSVPLSDQISGGSPGAMAGPQVMPPISGSGGMPQMSQPAPQGQGQMAGLPPESQEAQTIVQALSTRLKGLTSMQKGV